MKRRLAPLTASMILLGMVSTPALPNTQSTEILAQQIATLQQQVSELQAQLKNGQRVKHYQHAKKIQHKKRTKSTAPAAEQEETVLGVGELPTNGVTYLPIDVEVPGQSFVSSGPYIGIPLQYSGANLIINSPSVNQDVSLLKVRKNIRQRLSALGVPEETDHAHVLLSGMVEGQATYQEIGGGSDSSDVDITDATLDAYILGPSNWVSSLISMSYSNGSGASSGSLANNSRTLNSRMYLNQAFVTVGDFLYSPIYVSFGQMYVPFGAYSTSMISAPITKAMARTKARAIVLGYQPQTTDALYAAGYFFKGDTHVASTSRINNGGINLGYHFKQGMVGGDIGGGMIANIADSIGMQVVANTAANFNGFGGTNNTGNERIAHRVPALDLRGVLNLGSTVDLLGEYIAATTAFNPNDLSINNHGAKPRALNLEAVYTFSGLSRPAFLAIGYGMSKDALALGLPAQRYSMTANTSLWKNTLQSLELRHDINYSASNVATGSNVAALPASGKADNVVTAQFDVYF